MDVAYVCLRGWAPIPNNRFCQLDPETSLPKLSQAFFHACMVMFYEFGVILFVQEAPGRLHSRFDLVLCSSSFAPGLAVPNRGGWPPSRPRSPRHGPGRSPTGLGTRLQGSGGEHGPLRQRRSHLGLGFSSSSVQQSSSLYLHISSQPSFQTTNPRGPWNALEF